MRQRNASGAADGRGARARPPARETARGEAKGSVTQGRVESRGTPTGTKRRPAPVRKRECADHGFARVCMRANVSGHRWRRVPSFWRAKFWTMMTRAPLMMTMMTRPRLRETRPLCRPTAPVAWQVRACPRYHPGPSCVRNARTCSHRHACIEARTRAHMQEPTEALGANSRGAHASAPRHARNARPNAGDDRNVGLGRTTPTMIATLELD